jgi:5-methylcytosine-specific restriction endonuclease McrA
MCSAAYKARAEANRPTATQRGYGSQWRRESRRFLALPGNEHCACGCGRVANMVDHIVAPKGDPKLFWSRSNWQPFNIACNTRKAIRCEGAFGNKPGGGSDIRAEGLNRPIGAARNFANLEFLE